MNEHALQLPTREVPASDIELIRNTIAKGATDEELKLFLYDCARRNVHPLDKLLHFTVRKSGDGTRRYTPITSIDFMRMEAADGGCAGIDDVVFHGTPKQADFTASVTVYRVVSGIRCPFTGTARWTEYYQSSGQMWDKMPHTMLGKCAEALALRKAFPRQLGGLYSREEMDQAGMVEAETKTIRPPQRKEALPVAGAPEGTPQRIEQSDDSASTRPPQADAALKPPTSAHESLLCELGDFCAGDLDEMGKKLVELTTFTNKDGRQIMGKARVSELSEAAAKAALGKLRKQAPDHADAHA